MPSPESGRLSPIDFNTFGQPEPGERMVSCAMCGQPNCTDPTHKMAARTETHEEERSFETRIAPFVEEVDFASLFEPVVEERGWLTKGDPERGYGMFRQVDRNRDIELTEKEQPGGIRQFSITAGKKRLDLQNVSVREKHFIFTTHHLEWNIVICALDGSQIEYINSQTLLKTATANRDEIYAENPKGKGFLIDTDGIPKVLMMEGNNSTSFSTIEHPQALPDEGFVGIQGTRLVLSTKDGNPEGNLQTFTFPDVDEIVYPHVLADGSIRATVIRGDKKYIVERKNGGTWKAYCQTPKTYYETAYPQNHMKSLLNGGFCIDTTEGTILRQDPNGSTFRMRDPESWRTFKVTAAPDNGGILAIREGIKSVLWFPPPREVKPKEDPKQPPTARIF